MSADQKRELADRVVNSDLFHRSPKLRELFLYVTECTLDGRLEDVREQQIAHSVFNRRADYNPGQDNIVRVEARMLRKRLETYFLGEGVSEPVIITIPKGSYFIDFEARNAGTPTDVDTSTKAIDVKPPEKARLSVSRRILMAAGATLLIAACVGFYLLRQRTTPEWRASNSNQVLPFSAVFNNSKETYVVTSDTALVIIQNLAKKRVGLDDYINRQYATGEAKGPESDLIRNLQYRNYTDAGEMRMASSIILQNRNFSRQISMRSARSIQLPELKERNVLLIGSPVANPWGQLYYDSLPFQFIGDRPLAIRNMRPHAGERPEYTTPTQSGQTGDAYAVLALMPNFGGGSALLIAGTTAEATCAAGEFALDRPAILKVLETMGIDAAGAPKYFELLLRARTLPGSATSSAMVAWRRL